MAYFSAHWLKSAENPMQLKTYLAYLAVSYVFVFAFSMLPHMDREEKTGRSFKTKHGKFDEYQTVKGTVPASSIKMYINVIHFICFIVVIYLFSKQA